MLGIVIIFLFTVYLIFLFPIKKPKDEEEKVDPKVDSQMKKLWSIAQDSMREKKPMRAEKALLTILKFDETNAAAYNRLGILYAKSQKYDEAIECFEIAQSLDNNPSSLHNAGLIYLETGAYEKAAMAFRQALELEGDIPARFLALAKAEEKLGNRKAAIEALESAFDLDHTTTTLRQILAIYESTGDTENATATIARIEEQIAENEKAKEQAAKQRARIIPRPKIVKRTATKPAPKAQAKPATKAASSAGSKATTARQKITPARKMVVKTTKPTIKTPAAVARKRTLIPKNRKKIQ